MSQNPLGPVNIDRGTLLALAGATFANSPTANGVFNSADIVNPFAVGGDFGVNLTAVSGTVTIHIQGKDTGSGQYYDLLVSAGLSATGFSLLSLYPGLAVLANVSANALLPRTFRIQAVLSAAAVVTGNVGGSLLT